MTGNLGERVLAELEKYAIPVVSQLRIAVHGGTVAIMGAVPTEYEKQLVHHFSQKVPGVTQVVNLMRVIGGPGLTNGPEIPGARRGASPRRQRARSVSGMQLRFPFSARQLGTVAALLLLAWAGISFGMRDGSKLSVYPVTGRVEFEGATPDGAVLVLHPVDDQITMQPKALVKADGTFAFTTYLPADGAPAGDYRLTMTWNRLVEVDGEPVPGPNLLPAELADPATTKHQLTIATGNNELPPLQITQ
ncbi:MAG: BON domain-containing protein [Planctomycetales bacterium]